jgi:hypothetical protein
MPPRQLERTIKNCSALDISIAIRTQHTIVDSDLCDVFSSCIIICLIHKYIQYPAIDFEGVANITARATSPVLIAACIQDTHYTPNLS